MGPLQAGPHCWNGTFRLGPEQLQGAGRMRDHDQILVLQLIYEDRKSDIRETMIGEGIGRLDSHRRGGIEQGVFQSAEGSF